MAVATKASPTGFEQVVLNSDKGAISVSNLAGKIKQAKTASLKDTLFLSVYGKDRETLLKHIILSMPSGKYLLRREGYAAPSLERRIIDEYGVQAGTGNLEKIVRGLSVTHQEHVSADLTLGLDGLEIKGTIQAQKVLPIEKAGRWGKAPHRFDIRGVDTPGRGRIQPGVGYADKGKKRLSRQKHKGFRKIKTV